jgi:TP901 family phage tail tape measure protein
LALERYGLGAIITADEKPFVASTDRARNSLGQFISTASRAPAVISSMNATMRRAAMIMQQGASQISRGTAQLAAGLRSAALGALPLTIAVGAGISQAAKFERQISAVASITRASEREMAALTKEAKRMGIISVFSATEAGEAMEYLARAGADTNQVIAALAGTMNAAAADSIELSTAANIVAQVVRSMDLAWEDASHVADVLALASASANTNITLLGESFRYGASIAKGLDISLEQTTAIMAKLGDAGLKGSIAGTSFVNMMNKLMKPSEKASKYLSKWKVVMEDANKELLPVSSIVEQISSNMNKIPSATERASLAIELFGLRGVKAYNALRIAGKEATDDLEDKLIAASYGIGAAAEMAEKRLDNFLGRLKLFGASVESLSIGLFDPLLKSFTPVVEEMTKGLNRILFSLDALNDIRKEEGRQNSESAILLSKEVSQRLQAAGATQNYANATKSAIQVLSRMQMSEENLSQAQVEARKRGVLASVEAESRRRADMIKTAHIQAAGVKSEKELGELRYKMMTDQIKSMSEARQKEANNQIELAFSGAKGAAEAQSKLRRRILEEALSSNKELNDLEKAGVVSQIDTYLMLEAERLKRGDAIRSEIFSIEKLQEINSKYGSSAVQIALGMQDAIDGLRDAWDSLIKRVKVFGKTVEERFGKEGLRNISKYATYFVIIAAALVPLALSITALSFVLGGLAKAFLGLKLIAVGVITVIKGALIALGAAFWPIVAVVGALAIAFAFYRREGESFGQTMVRLWNDVKLAALRFYEISKQIIGGFIDRWNEVVDGIKDSWKNLWDSIVVRIEDTVNKIKNKFNDIFGHWFQGIEEMEINWRSVGAGIVNAIVWVSDVTIGIIDNIVGVITTLADIMITVMDGPLRFIAAMVDTIKANSDSIVSIFSEAWESVRETFGSVFSEIRSAINEIVAEFFGSSKQSSESWVTAGRTIGSAILAALHTVAWAIKWIVKGIGVAIKSTVYIIKTVLINLKRVFGDAFTGIQQILEGNFLSGIKRIGAAIFNALTLPIRTALGSLLKLVRSIPQVEDGLSYLGVDINKVQKWLDEGITFNEADKKKIRTVTAAKQASQSMEDANKASVKADTEFDKSVKDATRLSNRKGVLDAINDLKTQQMKKAAQPPKTDVNVNLEDKRVLDINNKMCVEGEAMDVATARHRQEIHDRAGYKSTPWQRRVMLEHGSAPVKRSAS